MDAGTILALGTVMLGLGSLGLFLVRFSNRRLRGLGWLGAAFVSGALGAVFLIVPSTPMVLKVLGSDLCVLMSFVLLQVAVMDLMSQRKRPSWGGLTLLCVLTVIDILYMTNTLQRPFRMASVSLMVALQCSMTAWTLWHVARRAERSPAIFCCALLAFFSAFNVLRTVLVVAGKLHQGHWDFLIITVSYVLYISMALGLAFGFFWMSTAQLSLQLEHMAGIDPLTRLYNRRNFLKACEAEMHASQKKGRPFSILMVDLDHFKKVNDLYGHQVGDAALVAVVESMQNSVRGIDILARWGGEEFAALLPNAALEAAYVVAERIRSNVEKIELPVEGAGLEAPAVLRMTVSIGLSACEVSDDIAAIMGRADQCLYLAKDSGRNCVLMPN